jgi:hypothetical protein
LIDHYRLLQVNTDRHLVAPFDPARHDSFGAKMDANPLVEGELLIRSYFYALGRDVSRKTQTSLAIALNQNGPKERMSIRVARLNVRLETI